MEFIGALSALEDTAIVAKPWLWPSPRDASLTDGGGVLRWAGGYEKGGDEPEVFTDAEDFLTSATIAIT